MQRSWLIVMVVIVMGISGCGSISRSENYSSYYSGVGRDVDVIENPYLWYFSLGLVPIVHIISLPVDAVIDTLLLPVDYSREKKKEFDRENATRDSIR